MDNVGFLIVWVIVAVLAAGLLLMLGPIAQAQFIPPSFIFISPPCPYYTGYGYFNAINGYLLGYNVFTPFSTPSMANSYNTLGIPTYPYLGSPYQTTYPYTTLSGTTIPYARFTYPTFTFGSPDFYLSWVLLQ